MNVITVINAKGGCGKSTIAMSLSAGLAAKGLRTLLIDMDPQAQVTQWLDAGDGLHAEGTLTNVFIHRQELREVIQTTKFDNLSFVASSNGLEEVGRGITDMEGYEETLCRSLIDVQEDFDVVVIDSPNQISPIMENAIYPTDLFIVPFESTKSVKSFANCYELLLNLRGQEADFEILHVLSNLTRQPGLRNRVLELMEKDRIPLSKTEMRTCGWLAQVDIHGGSIFEYRPKSKGAEDANSLCEEVLSLLEVTIKTS